MRLIPATFAALLLALPVLAQDAEVRARMAAFATAYNAGDATTVGAFYTDRAALLPPGQQIVVGRAAIAAHFGAAFGAGVKNLRYELKEVQAIGPTVLVIGETLVDAGAATVHGRFWQIWVNDGGTWRMHRDMYHVVGQR